MTTIRKKKYSINLELIELEKENYHIMVESRFSDNTTGYWIVDTGASKTVFDAGLEQYYMLVDDPLSKIESMGIGDSKVETSSGSIESILFGEVPFSQFNVALIDLSAINAMYQKCADKTISGLIGSDFLVKYNALIDFKKKVLIIHK
jgi:hypothetical protein